MLQALGKLAASAQRSLRLKAVSIISSRANNCNCRRVGRRISPSIREFCRVKPAAFGRIFSSNSQLPLRMIGVTPLGPSHLIMVSRTRRRPCNFGVLCSPVAACAGCTVQHCGTRVWPRLPRFAVPYSTERHSLHSCSACNWSKTSLLVLMYTK